MVQFFLLFLVTLGPTSTLTVSTISYVSVVPPVIYATWSLSACFLHSTTWFEYLGSAGKISATLCFAAASPHWLRSYLATCRWWSLSCFVPPPSERCWILRIVDISWQSQSSLAQVQERGLTLMSPPPGLPELTVRGRNGSPSMCTLCITCDFYVPLVQSVWSSIWSCYLPYLPLPFDRHGNHPQTFPQGRASSRTCSES